MEIKVIRSFEANPIIEEDEYCKRYVDTDKIAFGISILHPGHRGPVDPGHENAFEIWYIIKGKVLCYIPTDKDCKELNEGDAILLPPKKPHQPINVGDSIAIISWSQAKF